ncbi:MAG: HDIG domain-containing protein [Anaerolineae bacterium]|nr:HDIG domain-containing protein [Anaerolineae bacterium]MCX8067151.1 HDIG domain-containing protein [Anaerolineae bacterium]MDW7991946.1 HDIG domain-containing protein [Anaerolineae bacterium]
MQPTREEAWKLVTEYIQNPNLRKHMLAVEAAMRAYARRFGEDEEKWAVVGLLHDFDYERYPEEHPLVGARILQEQGWPEEIIRAVLSHAAERTGVERATRMEHTLYAVDDLTGLIVAVALVHPSKDIREITVKSVKNKWKDKRFAAGADRGAAEEGAAALGLDLWEHVGVVLEAMQSIAADLELDGRLASRS